MEENRRLRLGIIFKFNPSWMGGIIYILNLIKTFDFLDDKEKPEILLFYNPNLEKFISRINYPYLTVIKWSFPSIIKGNILSFLTRKNVFVDKILSNYDLDVLYPLHDFPVKTKSSVRLIHWCADLQYKYYPEFFPKWKIIVKNMRIKLALNNNNNTIVSSQSVLDDFKRFFKIRKDLNIHIYHFVSIIDKWDEININDLRENIVCQKNIFCIKSIS